MPRHWGISNIPAEWWLHNLSSFWSCTTVSGLSWQFDGCIFHRWLPKRSFRRRWQWVAHRNLGPVRSAEIWWHHRSNLHTDTHNTQPLMGEDWREVNIQGYVYHPSPVLSFCISLVLLPTKFPPVVKCQNYRDYPQDRADLLQSGPRCRTLFISSAWPPLSKREGGPYAFAIRKAVGLNFCTSGWLLSPFWLALPVTQQTRAILRPNYNWLKKRHVVYGQGRKERRKTIDVPMTSKNSTHDGFFFLHRNYLNFSFGFLSFLLFEKKKKDRRERGRERELEK